MQDRLRVVCVVVVALVATACAGRIRPGGPSAGRPPLDRDSDTYVATAYCQGTLTATGTRPNDRTIAADPDVLPMGSRIRVSGLERPFHRYNRTYLVSDTGAKIQGRRLDIYMRNCREAINFGRRTVRVQRQQ